MEKEFFYRGHTTMLLEYSLKDIDSFDEFEERFSDELLNEDRRFADYLEHLLFTYDKTAAGVSKAAGHAVSYVGNIINGKSKNPSRNTLITICLAMGTTFEEVQNLLKLAGHAPLYVRRKRDVIIWFGFMKKQSVEVVDDNLAERGFSLLLSDK